MIRQWGDNVRWNNQTVRMTLILVLKVVCMRCCITRRVWKGKRKNGQWTVEDPSFLISSIEACKQESNFAWCCAVFAQQSAERLFTLLSGFSFLPLLACLPTTNCITPTKFIPHSLTLQARGTDYVLHTTQLTLASLFIPMHLLGSSSLMLFLSNPHTLGISSSNPPFMPGYTQMPGKVLARCLPMSWAFRPLFVMNSQYFRLRQGNVLLLVHLDL